MSSYTQVIEIIKQRTILHEVIGQDVKLVRRGRQWKGCCPFHQEKSPSFHVHDDHGFYYCFGCGAKGDVFNYLTQQRKMLFGEAVTFLASKIGVDVPVFDRTRVKDPQEIVKQKTLLAVCQDAAQWYEHQLDSPKGEVARRYLQGRDLTRQTWTDFRLGYAPATGLENAMRQKGYAADILLEAGLLGLHEDGRLYDYFRDRLIFPIMKSGSGQVIAFGGRVLGNQKPKYLNSPQTPIFHKKQELYGLNKIDGRVEPLIIVEGYLDVIRLNQVGYHNVVAPLGTSITTQHLKRLWRLDPYPTICFDGDEAGQKAALRCAMMILEDLHPNQSARFIILPDGHDPDSFIVAYGLGEFKQFLKKTISLFDLIWNNHKNGFVEQSIERIEYQRRELTGLLRVIPDPILRNEFIQALSDKVRAVKNAHLPEVSSDPRPKQYFYNDQLDSNRGLISRQKSERKGVDLRYKDQPMLVQKILLVMIIDHPKLLESLFELLIRTTFPDPICDQLRQCIVSYWADHGREADTPLALSTYLKDHPFSAVLQEWKKDKAMATVAPFAFCEDTTFAQMCDGWHDLWYKWSVEKTMEEELAIQVNQLKENLDSKLWERIKTLKTNKKN